jgi:ParB family chromosome partitioning protein
MAKKGLGRGLDASVFGNLDSDDKPVGGIQTIKLSQIEPNKNQPRKTFDKSKIDALAQSIKDHGVIQPLVVVKNGDMYSIVAGERRWRAAKAAGISEVPAVIRDYTPRELMEIALIENIQREDLNPIEEALGYKSLMEDFDLTQDTVSQRIGKSRSAVANTLRLLSLDKKIQKMLISGELSSGHARAILSVENPSLHLEFAQSIIEKGMNVRQAEAAAKQLNSVRKKREKTQSFDIELDNVMQRLSSQLGTKVKISDNGKKGKIELEYYGNDDLERLLSIFGYRE